MRDADAVVVATNHTVFRGPAPLARIAELAPGDALVVDPWNCFGAAQVFGVRRTRSAARPRPAAA